MKDFFNKLSSRKFLSCVAGVVMGVCMVFGLDQNTVDTIAGAIVASSSILMYIYTEGRVDAKAVDGIKDVANKVEDAIGAVEKIEE